MSRLCFTDRHYTGHTLSSSLKCETICRTDEYIAIYIFFFKNIRCKAIKFVTLPFI